MAILPTEEREHVECGSDVSIDMDQSLADAGD
jgi:hypothetical protein